ncbi:MAG: ABC transporter substrate-binding protein [Anaerolineaceae bacterium]|jgi:polar amino acid transport system substrate-binding protein
MKVLRWIGLFVLCFVVAACSASPTVAPTAAVVAPTSAPTEAAAAAATVAPTPVATIPADQVVVNGHLTICSDIPYPPQEFFDENGNPQGMDVDIGNEIGNRLGLKSQYVNTVFDSIILAVTGGKCDIIISAMNVTADRQKQVSLIPYFQAGQSFVTLKGNPDNIKSTMDLCGKSAAAESGTTEADYLQGTGDYAGKGLTQACTAAGKPAINVVVTAKDTDALQQLQAGKVVIYSADSPVAAYYTVQHPDQFELAAGGEVLEPVQEGIGVPCGTASDCTTAPLSAVGAAVKAALQSMMADGTYQKILSNWNLSTGAVTLP